MLSSAVLSQALLSAGNFFVGLILIRRTTPDQYGYYVLIITAVLLLTALQYAFLQPSLVHCLTSQDLQGRRDFVGGLFREQQRWLLVLAALCAAVLGVLWLSGLVSHTLAVIVLVGIIAALTALYREFFRMVLLSYRLPMQALKVDCVFVLLLVGGAYLATRTPTPAPSAALTLAIAASVGGWLLSHMVLRHEGWNRHSAPALLATIAPMGTWAVVGAAIHWTFSQGYIYVVAGTLDVTAVATLAATRLLMMPVNLMSAGIGSMTFPTVSKWLKEYPVRTVFHRLTMLAGSIAGLAVIYLATMWLLRDWIFAHVIKGTYAHRDTLLMLWSAVFLLMAVRDQMLWLPAAKGRYRIMAWLTLATAVVSLLLSYVCMRLFGVVGALVGVLCGEAFNIIGFVALSLREIRIADDAQQTGNATP